jgi:hypothetical protein
MNERGLRDALRTLLFNQSRAGRGHQRRRRSCQPCPFGTRRTISRSTCRARARSFLRQRPASSSLRPPSQNPPRSSPLALAWRLKHRAHPSLEDFLGKRTPRCIGQESRWKPSRIGAGRFVRHQVSAGHRTGPDALGQTVRTLQLGL